MRLGAWVRWGCAYMLATASDGTDTGKPNPTDSLVTGAGPDEQDQMMEAGPYVWVQVLGCGRFKLKAVLDGCAVLGLG